MIDTVDLLSCAEWHHLLLVATEIRGQEKWKLAATTCSQLLPRQQSLEQPQPERQLAAAVPRQLAAICSPGKASAGSPLLRCALAASCSAASQLASKSSRGSAAGAGLPWLAQEGGAALLRRCWELLLRLPAPALGAGFACEAHEIGRQKLQQAGAACSQQLARQALQEWLFPAPGQGLAWASSRPLA